MRLGWLSSTSGRLGVLLLDRVTERRRAAQLARHYRDQESLTIAEIARRLGRAEATVKVYLYDPTGAKARAVKRRYQGVCRGCGTPTRGAGGKGDAVEYCKRCHPGAIAATRMREWVRGSMREWRRRHGRPPSSTDWSRTHGVRRDWSFASDLFSICRFRSRVRSNVRPPSSRVHACRPPRP